MHMHMYASMCMCVCWRTLQRERQLWGEDPAVPITPAEAGWVRMACREQEARGASFSQRCHHQQGRKRGKKQHLI